MPTNDERREVAKELRDFFPIDLVSELTDVDCHLASMVMGDKFCPSDCLWCFETVCERLADLIEPTPNRSEDTPKCDREALLETLSCMDAAVRWAGPDVERDIVEAWADDIRKALGVSE